MRSEVLLEQVQLTFSFRNKFIILLPYSLLVDNNSFSKMRIFNNNKIKGNEELMLIILKSSLLYVQNAGWTVPYPDFMVCCKNIYLRMLIKEAYIA